MKTELMLVTPETAQAWLKNNDGNRTLRNSAVLEFIEIWNRGEWKVTHQGIAFSTSGRLLDGQHRLSFVAALPDGTEVPLNVTTDAEEESFQVIDGGIKRTTADAYGKSSGLASVGRLFAKIHNSSQTFGLTNQYIFPFIQWCEPEYESLLTFCPTATRLWSSAPVRAAAIYQMKRGHDADFVKLAYHSLVHSDFESMPHACRAMVQQQMSGRLSAAKSSDLFIRSVRAFDSSQTFRVNRILIKDLGASIAEAREFIARDMKKGPAVAGPKVAKPEPKSTAPKQPTLRSKYLAALAARAA